MKTPLPPKYIDPKNDYERDINLFHDYLAELTEVVEMHKVLRIAMEQLDQNREMIERIPLEDKATHNTREGTEEILEQLFQYYDDIDCAVTVNQRIDAKEQAELWLKRTLHQELQKAREEMEAMVRQILSDTVPDEESEYVNVLNIKTIAQAHGITIN